VCIFLFELCVFVLNKLLKNYEFMKKMFKIKSLDKNQPEHSETRCEFQCIGILFITCFIPESSSKGRGGFATCARGDSAPNIQGAKDK
jgi:hypothetical protein